MKIFIDPGHGGDNNPGAIGAVSYTHLDVYKRQIFIPSYLPFL